MNIKMVSNDTGSLAAGSLALILHKVTIFGKKLSLQRQQGKQN